jgi:hypothetical protein
MTFDFILMATPKHSSSQQKALTTDRNNFPKNDGEAITTIEVEYFQ